MNTARLFVGAALALLMAGAGAQDSGTSGGNGGIFACRGDAQKFCQGIAPGGGKIRDCLAGHADDLSPACKSLVVKKPASDGAGTAGTAGTATGPVALAAACSTDAKTFCKGVQAGSGRISDCLIDHQKDISDGCFNALKHRQDAADAAAGAKAQSQ